MRYNHIDVLGRDASVLGFGCASLGSRIPASAGIRAVHLALDQGINWFDVAPSYGDGEAEEYLGRALKTRRDDAIICTKFGLSRPRISTAKRLLRPLAQRSLTWYPKLRKKISTARPRGERLSVRADSVERWLNDSLQRLGTDYVDVFALHDPTDAELADDFLFDALSDLKRRGTIRAIAVAGAFEATLLARQYRRDIDFVQFADSPYAGHSDRFAEADPGAGPVWVSHGVFGSGTLERITNEPGETQLRLAALADPNGDGLPLASSELMLRYALSNNAHGVVITSMFDPRHLEANCRIASRPPEPELARAVRDLVTGTPEP